MDWSVCLPLLLEVGQSLQTGFGDNLVGFISFISPKLNCLIFFYFLAGKNKRSTKIFVFNSSLLQGCVAQSSLNAKPLFIITLNFRHSLIVEDKSTSDQEQRRKTRRQFEVFLPGCAHLVIFSCSLFFMARLGIFTWGPSKLCSVLCVQRQRGKMMRLLCLLLRRQLWGGLFRSKKFLKGATETPALTSPG